MDNQQIENYEEWRTCEDAPHMEVSNLGRVRSGITKHIYSLQKRKDGYITVSVTVDRKSVGFRVHRLVAKAFLPLESRKREVNHIDCDKSNNKVENLEWVSSKENKEHGWSYGLYKDKLEDHCHAVYTNDQIHRVCELLGQISSNLEISEITGVSKDTVASIRSGVIWKDISKLYTFDKKYMTTKTREDVVLVAELLMIGLNTEDIMIRTGLGRGEINRIRRKDVHKDILSVYDFPINKFARVDTEIVVLICELLSKGMKVQQVADNVGITRSVVSKIKNKKAHTEISNKYEF